MTTLLKKVLGQQKSEDQSQAVTQTPTKQMQVEAHKQGESEGATKNKAKHGEPGVCCGSCS